VSECCGYVCVNLSVMKNVCFLLSLVTDLVCCVLVIDYLVSSSLYFWVLLTILDFISLFEVMICYYLLTICKECEFLRAVVVFGRGDEIVL
jgi:hypothetical protein